MKCYKITNLVNDKCYIGITTMALEKRWRDHLSNAKVGKKSYLYDSIRKYGFENFIIEEIAVPLKGIEDLKELEKNIISQESSKAPNGYNLTDGGDGVRGYSPSLETRKKISDSCKGKPNLKNRKPRGPMKEETKLKIKNTLKGTQRPPEVCAKLKASWAIRKQTSEILNAIAKKETLHG